MKYFVSTINDDLRDEIHFKKPLVVTADKDEKAEKIYRTLHETDDSVIVYPVVDGMVDITMQVDNFRVGYSKDTKVVTVCDKRTNKTYVGVLINIIKAGETPTEEEILEYYYRGNVNKYRRDLEASKLNNAIRLNLRRIRKAIPWDRWVVDVGYHQVIIPITENYQVMD